MFQATNGKYYTVTVEAMITQANPEWVKDVLEEEKDGDVYTQDIWLETHDLIFQTCKLRITRKGWASDLLPSSHPTHRKTFPCLGKAGENLSGWKRLA